MVRNINRSLVLSFKNSKNNPRRNSFDRFYMLLVEIENLNVLVDNKPFLDQQVKKPKTKANKSRHIFLLKCQ